MPRSYTVVVTPDALADIGAIQEFIARDSPIDADRFTERLIVALQALDRFPARYPVTPESDAFGFEVRVMLVGPYRVLFAARPEVVLVLRIRHSARDRIRSPDAP